MRREDLPLVAATAGALLIVAGAYGLEARWIFVSGGVFVALPGLAAAGARGVALLFACGVWLAGSVLVGGWALAPWNLMVTGLAAVALGFLGAASAPRAEAW